MERYHDTSNDPVPLFSPAHEAERARIARLTQRYLDKGGSIDKVGFQMSDKPASFVVNARRSPVYAHLFTHPNTLH